MACVPAPACKAALSQATALWPNRSRASDGICPSAAHTSANPSSDHERGNAVDLTHDPARGCDAHAWARAVVARRDPRVSYVISARQIANSISVAGKPPWTWRYYGGTNPHTTHAHVSIKSGARNDTSSWFAAPPPPPNPFAPLEVDVQIQPVKVEMSLDAQGRGNVTVPYAIDRIIGFLPHSEVRPNVDGRYDDPPNSVTFTPDGTGTVVVVQNGTPLGRAHIWLRVAA